MMNAHIMMRRGHKIARRLSALPSTQRVYGLPSRAWKSQAGAMAWSQSSISNIDLTRDTSVVISRNLSFTADTADAIHADIVETEEEPTKRVHFLREEPVEEKIRKLMAVPLGQMHPRDMLFASVDFMAECGKRKNFSSMSLAEDLLNRIIAEKRVHSRFVLSTKPFDVVIMGWTELIGVIPLAQAKSCIDDVLRLMEEESKWDKEHPKEEDHDADGTPTRRYKISCEPSAHTFNTILRGYAAAARDYPSASMEAERLLDAMLEHHQQKGWNTKPNTRSYAHVMMAYARTRKYEAGTRAQMVLERMKRVHETEKRAYEVRHGVPYDLEQPQKNKCQIVTPDKRAYASVIMAYANSDSRDAASQAEALLNEMMERGVAPDGLLVASVIHAWGRKASLQKLPKHRCEAAAHAEDILWRMKDILSSKQKAESSAEGISQAQLQSSHDETQDDFVDDDHLSGRKATGIVSSKDAGNREVHCYNGCLEAWAKSDIVESAPRAEALLQRMVEDCLADETAVKPDRTSFNIVLNAWARYGRYDPQAPKKAEELLGLMYDLSLSGRLSSVKPDRTSYTTVMNAWARSEVDHDRTSQARRLLDTMLYKYDSGEYDMKPDRVAFSVVLNAAAYSPTCSVSSKTPTTDNVFASTTDHEDAYSIALQTWKELQNDAFGLGIKLDHFVYALMLQVVGQHTHESSVERKQMIEEMFNQACTAGQVSTLVIRALRKVCPSTELLERLLQSPERAKYMNGINELPKQWTRNVPKTRRFRIFDRKKPNTKQRSQTAED